MPDPQNLPSRMRLTEDQLAQVIGRAIELDSRASDGVPLVEVQRIADELGISPEAIARAVGELQRGAPPAPVSQPLIGTTHFTALILGIAAIGGALVGEKTEPVNFWLFFATIAAAIPYRHFGLNRAYFRDLAALWIGFGFGWFTASAFTTESDTLFHLLVPGLAAAAFGWCLQRLRWRWASPDAAATGLHGATSE